MKAVTILIVVEEPIMIEGPLKEEGSMIEVEGHQTEKVIRIEDIPEEEDPWMMEEP